MATPMEWVLQRYHDYGSTVITATPTVIGQIVEEWTSKMWDTTDSAKLLSAYLRLWPWEVYLQKLTKLQADNVLRYIKSHDEEQIINHVMDLEKE